MMHINLQVPRLAFACKSFESSMLKSADSFSCTHPKEEEPEPMRFFSLGREAC